MAKDEETKEGLQLLDDRTLADLVNNEMSNYGELKTEEAIAAFSELKRRTPE